jgi:hypothetical protein
MRQPQHLENIIRVEGGKKRQCENNWRRWKFEGASKSKKNKNIKILKMLLEATQVHELLTNTFYKTKLKYGSKMFFSTTPFDFKSK